MDILIGNKKLAYLDSAIHVLNRPIGLYFSNFSALPLLDFCQDQKNGSREREAWDFLLEIIVLK